MSFERKNLAYIVRKTSDKINETMRLFRPCGRPGDNICTQP